MRSNTYMIKDKGNKGKADEHHNEVKVFLKLTFKIGLSKIQILVNTIFPRISKQISVTKIQIFKLKKIG